MAALVIAAACDTAEQPADAADPVEVVDTAGVETVPLPPAPLWRAEEAGPALLVPGRLPRTAALVLPGLTDSTIAELRTADVSAVAPSQVDLFARRGQVGTATLQAVRSQSGAACLTWPISELRAPDGGLLAPWTVALTSGRASPLPLDSIEALVPADSATLAAELTRLASMAPGDTAAVFRGLPFVVRTARRFTLPGDTLAVAALIVRRIGSEANQQAEHLFLLAERPRGARTWTRVHLERAIGPEETVETTDVLAALLLGPSRPSLFLIRDYGDGTTFALLERDGGRWQVRWSSAYTGGC